MSRKMLESRPSVQSRVAGSSTPYSSEIGIAFGLMTNCLVGSRSIVCARAQSVPRQTVLPPPVGPTIIVVWRVISVS